MNDDIKKVITLPTDRRRRQRRRCEHYTVIVDPYISDEVECKHCGKKLNAVSILWRMAQEQHDIRIESIDTMKKKMEELREIRCIHCQKMTPINGK